MTEPGTAPLVGRDVTTGDPVAIQMEGDRIASIGPAPSVEPQALPWIGPGLVDLQVNGFAGIDLNNGLVSSADVAGLTQALLAVGTTSFLPTVTTASASGIEASLRSIADVIAAEPTIAAAVTGIHLEGPFISPEDGPRGAHPAAHVRPPDWDLFDRWQRAADGRIRIITLSPEWPGAPVFIARCRASGVIVAIGHTAATPEQIRLAVAAGASLSTHLGNGAHPVLARHPNYLWEQLASDGLWVSVIADGFHLPDAVLKVVLRVKGDRAILVSDTVDLAGLAPGEYDRRIGGRVVLTESGRLHLAADPRLLAGSVRPLVDGIAHLARSGLATLGGAWAKASIRPASLLGLPRAVGLAPGAPADLVLFRWNGERIDVERVAKSGRTVYSRSEAMRSEVSA